MVLKLRKKQFREAKNQVHIYPLDKGSGYGSNIYVVELSKPMEKSVFHQAMQAEFGWDLKNKSRKFTIEFSFKKFPNNVLTRIISRLSETGHIKINE